jgi:hypothetical protein
LVAAAEEQMELRPAQAMRFAFSLTVNGRHRFTAIRSIPSRTTADQRLTTRQSKPLDGSANANAKRRW